MPLLRKYPQYDKEIGDILNPRFNWHPDHEIDMSTFAKDVRSFPFDVFNNPNTMKLFRNQMSTQLMATWLSHYAMWGHRLKAELLKKRASL
jgi:hypothetical protein